MSVEDFENEGRLKRRLIGGGVVLVIAGVVTAFVLQKPTAPAPKKPKASEMVIVSVPPPLPPPPPPPPEPEKQEEPEEKEEMIEQEPVVENEPVDPGPEEPPADLGTGLTGDGSNSFGLSSRGDGGNRGTVRPGQGGGRFDRYAVILQNTLASELRRNSKTRNATFNVQVSVRIDSDGRITSIKPKSSTGDPSVDAALRNDFIGVRFSQAPPADMPMPVHTRLVGRKR